MGIGDMGDIFFLLYIGEDNVELLVYFDKDMEKVLVGYYEV